MNPNNGVYDENDQQPVTKPDLLDLEKGSPNSGQHQEGGLFNPDGDKKDSKALDNKTLGGAERSGLPGEKLGKGYSPQGAITGGIGAKLAGILKNPKNRRRSLILGGGGGGIATIAIIALFVLAPLKIESIVTDYQEHFDATTISAVSNETDNIFANYITKHVLPSYRGCGNTISKDCSVNNIIGTNPVDNLYRTWANAKLENKLAQDYGIEFKFDKASKSWYVKTPNTSGKGEGIGAEGENLSSVFQKADQATLRNAISDALENETKWQKVLDRYKYGHLLEEKYGVKRCIMFCGTQDALQNFSNEKKNAAQIFLTQRVLIPRTDTLGIVMECLLDPNCNAESTQPTTAEDGTNGDLAGEAENAETDSAVRYHLGELASSYGITDQSTIEGMVKDYQDLDKRGYSNYALEAILEKVGLSDLSENITNTAPLIGWANTAASLITDINKSGPSLKKLAYITNSESAISLFMMYRTYADEIHTGHVDATEAGSFVSSLGSGDGSSSEIGGTATAEQTPLYNSIVGGSSASGSSGVALLNSLSPNSTVYADSTSSSFSSYKCADGKPVPSGQLVCSEEKIGGGNDFLNSVHGTLNTPPLSFITGVAGVWSSLPGKLLGLLGNLFGSVLDAIPGISSLVHDAAGFVSNIAKPFFTFLTNKLVPDPFGANMSGGRTGDLIAMGADASYSSYAQTGIGGEALNPTQVASIDSQQDTQAQQQFAHETFFARVFDTNSTYSLLSKLALAMPTNVQTGAENSFASLISNPLNLLSTTFSSLFSSKASAAQPPQADPFGITQYGYPSGTIPSNPEQYWNANCSDNPSQAYQNTNNWNEQAAQTTDPNTGMSENTSTNPCLLIEATVGSDGATYNSNLLTSDEQAALNGSENSSNASSSTSTANTYFTVKGDVIDDPNGNQFVPYGVSVIDDLDQSNWQKYAAASDAQIQAAAQYWHVNTIRLQVSEDNILSNPSPNEPYNIPAMQRLGSEVDEIESLGKIPIINDNTEITTPSQHGPTTTTIAFWNAVTTYLAGQNNTGKYSNVIFDIYNEPSDGGWSEWQNGGSGYVGMQQVVNAIRNGAYLSNNLIMVEGPHTATTLDQLDNYPISGGNIAFAYHHVDLDDPSSWNQNIGLELKTPVPIIDGEWAQYAALKNTRQECWPDAPQHIQAYFNTLSTNHIGLIFWALEPGVGTQTFIHRQPWSNGITDAFPTNATDYSQPNTFSSNYSCIYGTAIINQKPTPVLIGQGAGADVMSYFQKMTGN